jgi:hypothetical protein
MIDRQPRTVRLGQADRTNCRRGAGHS